MSQENVEIVRRSNALWSAGDAQAAMALLHPDVEWIIAREHPSARTITGFDGVEQYRREWEDAIPDMHFELNRVLDAGEQVVAIGTVAGTGPGSKVAVRVPLAFVFTLRSGLIVRCEEYLRAAEALEAVGLSE
jgi:ketosteroid isomerase-like protein